MTYYILDQFLTTARAPLLNPHLIKELDAQLKTLIPNWIQWILIRVQNRFLTQLLTGIEIKLITNADEPGKITIEIWKDSKSHTDISYIKEVYITEIEGKANKNNANKIKLEDTTL